MTEFSWLLYLKTRPWSGLLNSLGVHGSPCGLFKLWKKSVIKGETLGFLPSFHRPVWINKAEERTGGKRSQGKTGTIHGSGLQERRRRLFFGGGGGVDLKKKPICTEILHRGLFFITYSRRIYSLLQNSFARCLRSSTVRRAVWSKWDWWQWRGSNLSGEREIDRKIKRSSLDDFVNSPVVFNWLEGWRRSGEGEARRWDVASGRRCFFFSSGKVRNSKAGENLLPVWNVDALLFFPGNGECHTFFVMFYTYIILYVIIMFRERIQLLCCCCSPLVSAHCEL